MGSYARVIGLCGKIASGKDVVASLLEKKGFFIIDADKIGHEALKEKKICLVKKFGTSILDDKGEIERKKLGKIVFSKKSKLIELEKITHPWIKEKIIKLIETNPQKKIIINAALLYPVGLDSLCEKVIVVEANFFIRIKRLVIQRKLPFFYALKIVINQKKIVYKNFKNIIIKNESSLKKLEETLFKINL